MLYYIQHYFISKLKHVQLNFFLCTKIYFEGGGAKNISNQLTVLPLGLEGMDLSLAFMLFIRVSQKKNFFKIELSSLNHPCHWVIGGHKKFQRYRQ